MAVGLAVAGCNRKPPRFVPRGADSSLTVQADSLGLLVGVALDLWEGQKGDQAAPATSRLLLDDLGRHPDAPLAERTRTFLDSCGFSAEVAGSGEVTAVNFFSRSDPGGASWPLLVWREEGIVRGQSIEGSGMRLFDLALRPGEERTGPGGGAGAPAQVAAIFGRTGKRGQQPVVIAWRRPPGGRRWALAQTLGPDSLGGVGVAEFVTQADGSLGIEARTYRATTGFDECATCPHIHRTLRFEWAPGGFRKSSEEVAASPYLTFVRLIAALAANDRELALQVLSDPSLLEAAQGYEWDRAKGPWRVAPGTDESAEEMTFFRGRREAYRVRFASRDNQWVVTDFQPVPRAVE